MMASTVACLGLLALLCARP